MTLSLRRSDREGAWLRTPRYGRLLAALVLASLDGRIAAATEVRVHVTGAQVDLDATAAPVADVLDRLARQTGIKVVYEGPKPRQVVTLRLRGRSPADTVLAVLEGLGVNFVLVAERTGQQAQTLMVSAAPSGGSAARTDPARSPSPAVLPLPEEGFEETPEEAPEDLAMPQPPTTEPQPPPQVPQGSPAPATGTPAGAPPIAPGQLFPVSPFAPQPPLPAPPLMAPQPGTFPGGPRIPPPTGAPPPGQGENPPPGEKPPE